MKTVLWIVGILMGLSAWVGSAHAQAARCAPEAEAGWISSFEISELGRSSGPPQILVGKAWVPVEAGAPLCANDKVVNPTGSRRVVMVRLAGRQPVPVKPGQDLTAPDPGFNSVKLLVRKFLGGKPAGATPQAIAGASRGSACTYNPIDPELVAYVIRGFGVLHVSWPCAEGGPWELLLVGPDGNLLFASMPLTNVADISIDGCEPNCQLVVHDKMAGKIAVSVIIRPVDIDNPKLPGDLASRPRDALRDAMIGAELSKRRDGDGWHMMGNSLLYGSACYVPAAGRLAQSVYGYLSRDEPCLALDTQADKNVK